ncbi:MAG: flavin reductase family protein [Alphaproteobacteria bacterium]|nr:flavin reductase family protein [Alphaproteobacteria bacterium]
MDTVTFRNACGQFATGVTVITTIGPGGELIGVTANSFSSVSLAPPLLLFCLGRDATSFSTFQSIGHFAINVLHEDQKDDCMHFARVGDDGRKPFEGIDYETWDTGAPILSGCLANFECTTENIHDAGDHVIMVGRVNRMRAEGEGKPLIFHAGKFHQI